MAWQSDAWEICSICSIRVSGSSQITPSLTSHGASVVSAIVVVAGIPVVVAGNPVVEVGGHVPSVVVSSSAVVVSVTTPVVVGAQVVVPMVVALQDDRRGSAGPLTQPSHGYTASQ